MKDFKKGLIFLSLVISLILSGCKENSEVLASAEEDISKNTPQEETDTSKQQEDLYAYFFDNNLNTLEESEKEYAIEDLYVVNEPNLTGGVTSTFAKKVEYSGKEVELEEGKEYEFFESVVNPGSILYFDKNCAISCGKEAWLPDYRGATATEASTYINFLEPGSNYKTLTSSQIESFERSLNNTTFFYRDDHIYQIDKLLLVNSNGYYSLYSMERMLVYANPNGNPIFYFFDINNYQNALKVIPDIKEEDFDGTIDIGCLLKCEITSLDAAYALSLQDVEHDVIIGDYWYKGIYNGMNIQVNEFSKYLTDEQFERGYLTQSEVEDLVNSLNNGKKYIINKRGCRETNN